MAIIKCVECGKEISSLATVCPNCGCPSEYQTGLKSNNISINPTNDEQELPRLIYQDRWERIVELVKQGNTQDAQAEIEQIIGKKGSLAIVIIARIIRVDGIPFDYIIEKYPQLAYKSNKNHPEPAVKPCSVCGRVISSRAESCPHCGNPTGVHVCPSCGSTNTSVITGEEKGLSMFLFRGYSTNTVMSKFKCKDCGHKW